MDLATEISKRLKEKGWRVVRTTGKHVIWQHPNGSFYPVPKRMKDTGRKRTNSLRNIKALEGDSE